MGPQPEYRTRKLAPDDEIVDGCLQRLGAKRFLAAVSYVVSRLTDTPENRTHIASIVHFTLDLLINAYNWRMAGMIYVRYRERLSASEQVQYEEAILGIATTTSLRERKRAA
jgi:hypothetical protein